jgi:type IV secretion system protein VirB1
VSAVLSLVAILQLAATPDCTAPGMPPANVAAVARQESGFHPYAIRDETTDRSHYPATREDAEALAARLTAQGHLLGVGLMQLTPPANFGLSIAEAFDPCKNMKAGAELLAANYNLEWQALMRALSRYNSGSPTRAEAYAKRVAAQAQRNAHMPSLALHPFPNLPAMPAPSSQRSAPPAAKPPCAPTWDVWAVCRQPETPAKPPEIKASGAPAVEAAADTLVQCVASFGGLDYVDYRPHPCGGRFVALLRVALA